MSVAKSLDVGQNVVHVSVICRKRLTGQGGVGNFLILSETAAGRIADIMVSGGVDMDRVRSVLREAVEGDSATFSQRKLAKKAGVNSSAISDILKGKSKVPSIRTLSALAEALGGDLATTFGIADQRFEVSVAELQRALAESIPAMPADDVDRQARFLAEVVADALGLPADERPSGGSSPRRAAAAKAVPPHGPTT